MEQFVDSPLPGSSSAEPQEVSSVAQLCFFVIGYLSQNNNVVQKTKPLFCSSEDASGNLNAFEEKVGKHLSPSFSRDSGDRVHLFLGDFIKNAPRLYALTLDNETLKALCVSEDEDPLVWAVVTHGTHLKEKDEAKEENESFQPGVSAVEDDPKIASLMLCMLQSWDDDLLEVERERTRLAATKLAGQLRAENRHAIAQFIEASVDFEGDLSELAKKIEGLDEADLKLVEALTKSANPIMSPRVRPTGAGQQPMVEEFDDDDDDDDDEDEDEEEEEFKPLAPQKAEAKKQEAPKQGTSQPSIPSKSNSNSKTSSLSISASKKRLGRLKQALDNPISLVLFVLAIVVMVLVLHYFSSSGLRFPSLADLSPLAGAALPKK